MDLKQVHASNAITLLCAALFYIFIVKFIHLHPPSDKIWQHSFFALFNLCTHTRSRNINGWTDRKWTNWNKYESVYVLVVRKFFCQHINPISSRHRKSCSNLSNSGLFRVPFDFSLAPLRRQHILKCIPCRWVFSNCLHLLFFASYQIYIYDFAINLVLQTVTAISQSAQL